MTPLNTVVSVIVVTFNSSKFIEETLNSITLQNWPEIELIITDDCSNDNTVAICREWIKKHERRFVRTHLITSPINTGTTSNLNRGLSAAKGEWIKFCAGDDALMPNCIEDNLKHIAENPEIKVLFSYCRMYLEETTEDCFTSLNPKEYPSHIMTNKITAKEQHKLLLVTNRIPFAPSAFIHVDTLINYGGIDVESSYSEDYQMWLSLTGNDVKLYFMEKETMKYRIHANSLSKQNREFIVNPIYFKAELGLRNISFPYIPWDLRFSKRHSLFVNQIFRINALNSKSKFNSALYFVLNKLLNPFHYIIYIKSHYCKKYQNDYFYK